MLILLTLFLYFVEHLDGVQEAAAVAVSVTHQLELKFKVLESVDSTYAN